VKNNVHILIINTKFEIEDCKKDIRELQSILNRWFKARASRRVIFYTIITYENVEQLRERLKFFLTDGASTIEAYWIIPAPASNSIFGIAGNVEPLAFHVTCAEVECRERAKPEYVRNRQTRDARRGKQDI
jgi:hypothetical protein